jgi:hypothetical protein
MNFGDPTDEDTSFAIMDTAVDNDVNFFDSVDPRAEGFGQIDRFRVLAV